MVERKKSRNVYIWKQKNGVLSPKTIYRTEQMCYDMGSTLQINVLRHVTLPERAHDKKENKKDMNRQDLIAAIAEKTGVTKKDTDAVVKAFTEIVMDDVAAGNKVQLIGFGTFESVERAAREGRNPRTNETMTIAASRSPKFKPAAPFKQKLN